MKTSKQTQNITRIKVPSNGALLLQLDHPKVIRIKVYEEYSANGNLTKNHRIYCGKHLQPQQSGTLLNRLKHIIELDNGKIKHAPVRNQNDVNEIISKCRIRFNDVNETLQFSHPNVSN